MGYICSSGHGRVPISIGNPQRNKQRHMFDGHGFLRIDIHSLAPAVDTKTPRVPCSCSVDERTFTCQKANRSPTFQKWNSVKEIRSVDKRTCRIDDIPRKKKFLDRSSEQTFNGRTGNCFKKEFIPPLENRESIPKVGIDSIKGNRLLFNRVVHCSR